jgi:transposase-like protein
MRRRERETNPLIEGLKTVLKEGKPLSGKDGFFSNLLKQTYEAILEEEMELHMEGSKEEMIGNRLNGRSRKQMKSSYGSFELETPRDRHGSFEPSIIPKRQTSISQEIDDKILALYKLGTSYEDIKEGIRDLYGFETSDAIISAISDRLLEDIQAFRSKPLDEVYAIVFLDAMFVKVREKGAIVTKAVYSLIAVDMKGVKQCLGFYLAETEGASTWSAILADLKVRGIKDILFVCVDGLKGLPDAIEAHFPRTIVQLCVVHQIRNSLKYVSWKERKNLALILKSIYTASSKEIATENLRKAVNDNPKYQLALKGWLQNADRLFAYFQFSPPIRKLIYTTNSIENFHRQIRKFIKTKSAFTSEQALIKSIYCATIKASKKWSMPLQHWYDIIPELELLFPNRINLEF